MAGIQKVNFSSLNSQWCHITKIKENQKFPIHIQSEEEKSFWFRFYLLIFLSNSISIIIMLMLAFLDKNIVLHIGLFFFIFSITTYVNFKIFRGI